MDIDGTWDMTIQTPRGTREAALLLTTTGGTLTGTLGDTAIEDARITSEGISFGGRLTSPLKLNIKCTAQIDGDTMTGEAKTSLLPLTVPFTATRRTG
jgi:hypothetical protein